MATNVTEVDAFVPDYEHQCENCGQTPVVCAEKNGRVILRTTLCGPCTWDEAAMLDPAAWNDSNQWN